MAIEPTRSLVLSSFLSASVLDWHYACLQTRNVVEANRRPSAFHFLVVLFVPAAGPAAMAPPFFPGHHSSCYGCGDLPGPRPIWCPRCWPAGFSLGAWLAGVWLVFGCCLRGHSNTRRAHFFKVDVQTDCFFSLRSMRSPWPYAMLLNLSL